MPAPRRGCTPLDCLIVHAATKRARNVIALHELPHAPSAARGLPSPPRRCLGHRVAIGCPRRDAGAPRSLLPPARGRVLRPAVVRVVRLEMLCEDTDLRAARENRTPVLTLASCGCIRTHPDGTYAAGRRTSDVPTSISSAPNPRGSPRPGAPSSRASATTTRATAPSLAAHVAVAMPGALTAGDLLCDARRRTSTPTWRARTRRRCHRTAAQIDAALAADPTSPRSCDEAGRALPRRAGRVRPRHRGDAASLGPQAAWTRWTRRRGRSS